MKEGPWHKQAIEKGLIVGSVTSDRSVLSAAASGGAGVALAAIPDGLDEATWQQIVVGFAVAHGWEAAHCRKVLIKKGKKEWWETTMPTGWFDLVLARGGVYFVELKVRPNVRTPEQEHWAAVMEGAGQSVRLWYPEHWQEVQETLR